MCRFLLAHGADPRIRDDGGETPLSKAATSTKRKRKVVQLFLDQLEEGEDVNDYFGEYTVEVELKKTGPVTDLLRKRGLVIPPDEDEE